MCVSTQLVIWGSNRGRGFRILRLGLGTTNNNNTTSTTTTTTTTTTTNTSNNNVDDNISHHYNKHCYYDNLGLGSGAPISSVRHPVLHGAGGGEVLLHEQGMA